MTTTNELPPPPPAHVSPRTPLTERARHNWLELTMAIVVIAMVVFAATSSCVNKGVIAVRRIPNGALVRSDDVGRVPVFARPHFQSPDEVIGLIAQREIDRGELVRRSDVGAAYAIASNVIVKGSTFKAGDVKLDPHAFVADGLRDLSFVGCIASTAIPASTVITKTMVAPCPDARALQAIEPFRFLTSAEMAEAPPRTCSVVAVAKGAVIPLDALMTVDERFDRILRLEGEEIKAAVPRVTPGSLLTLLDVTDKAKCNPPIPAQLLSAPPERVIVAVSRADVKRLAAAEKIRAVQDMKENVVMKAKDVIQRQRRLLQTATKALQARQIAPGVTTTERQRLRAAEQSVLGKVADVNKRLNTPGRTHAPELLGRIEATSEALELANNEHVLHDVQAAMNLASVLPGDETFPIEPDPDDE